MGEHPTALQARLAEQIMSHVRILGLEVGHHLTEDALSEVLGTSRTPIRAAMLHLASVGVLERRPNRGFVVRTANGIAPSEVGRDDEERVYRAIAMDRLGRTLPNSVSESLLVRRYEVSRAKLRLVLARIAAEGWVERKPGNGWAFHPLIDTMDGYRQSYELRCVVEPAAMRFPRFRADPKILTRLHAQQVFVQTSGFESLSLIELFEINSKFHETLAELSGNRFVAQIVTRLNQYRRLMEYDRPLDRDRVRRVCAEHIGILVPLLAGDVEKAARELECHLASAVDEKSVAPR